VEHVIDEMRLSDAAVVAAVKRALAADPMVGKIPIDVDSSAGNIRLKSDQTGKDDRTRAVEVASKIDGVANVEDLMR
jgi:osmotically-inducible protein OsmY